MALAGHNIPRSKCLEVHTIMGEQGFVLPDRIRQLLGIVVTELSGFLCRDDDAPARPPSRRAHHIHIFIEI